MLEGEPPASWKRNVAYLVFFPLLSCREGAAGAGSTRIHVLAAQRAWGGSGAGEGWRRFHWCRTGLSSAEVAERNARFMLHFQKQLWLLTTVVSRWGFVMSNSLASSHFLKDCIQILVVTNFEVKTRIFVLLTSLFLALPVLITSLMSILLEHMLSFEVKSILLYKVITNNSKCIW